MAESVVGKAPIKGDHRVARIGKPPEAKRRYFHLPTGERKLVENILRGCCPLDKLPEVKPRIVRVFISSTFTDMKNERNRLMERVYPKLKAYCRERYGVEFQTADMRWGIPKDAWKSHVTNDLCLSEIRNCARQSLGPHFILFLGQRYGSRSLPASIPSDQYEAIWAHLQKSEQDVTLLDQWYLKDDNYQPPVYTLQPISKILGENDSSWNSISQQLDQLLLQGAEACVAQGTLNEEVMERFKASVTHLEIMEALKTLPKQEDRDRQFLTFLRTIVDIDNFIDCEKAINFIDPQLTDQSGSQEAQTSIVDLRQKVIKREISDGNLFEAEINWIDPTGVDPEGHDDYLKTFSENFYEKTRGLIDLNVNRNRTTKKDNMYDDVLHHWIITKEKCEQFMGREDVLQKIKDYVLGSAEEPYIVHGKSGHGKTSIMAKAASNLHEWFQDNGQKTDDLVVAVRFCGTSRDSSNITSLLPSLCHQLAYTTGNYEKFMPYTGTYKQVKSFFIEFLRQNDHEGLLVVFIDAVDQLSPNDGAHKMDWLPAKIAKNVKIIISTLPEQTFEHLQAKITNKEQYVQVNSLDPRSCEQILRSWLEVAGKTLQTHQWQLAKTAFESCSLPLFVKLTFEVVLKWQSYQEIDTLALNNSVDTSINALFDHLEAKYGKILVRHSLAYLTASKGLSEAEMDDILSIDDIVLNAVFEFHEPPIRRFPPNLWQRIRHDIKSYLVEREDSGISVMYWYHRQFISAAKTRYLCDPAIQSHIHGTIADYLLGTWSGEKKKPYCYEPSQMRKLERENPEGEAVRNVPEQPLIFTTFSNSKHYNLRKLNHLPYQLAKAGRHEKLFNEVYFNYNWLSTKLQAGTIHSVLADYSLVDDKETALVEDALRNSECVLSRDLKILSIELTGRLLPLANKYTKIRSLIQQCDKAAVTSYGVVPNWQVYTCPGGPLHYVCQAEASITSSPYVAPIETSDRVLLTAKPAYCTKLQVWDITQGESLPDINLPSCASVHPTLNGRFLTIFHKNRSMKIYRVENGEFAGEVNYGNGVVQHVSSANKYVAFTLKTGTGPIVMDIEEQTRLHRFDYQSKTVTVTKDDRYLICNAGQLVACHELPSMERKCLVKVPDEALKLEFHANDSSRFFALLKNNELQACTMDFVKKANKSYGVLQDDELQDFRVSHTNKLLLARALRCLFIFDIDKTCKFDLRYRIIETPADVKMSVFAEADFTLDDKYLVAGRHSYLGVWRAENGEPLCFLEPKISTILNVFTCSTSHTVMTVLKSNAIQVWDLTKLEDDVNDFSIIVKGAVKSLDVASHGNVLIACGSQQAEASILDLATGQVQHTLVHSDDAYSTLRKVHISPQGRYCVTKQDNTDVQDYQKPWNLLTEDKLWDTRTGQILLKKTRVRQVLFSNDDEWVVFFRCQHYSSYDFTVKAYEAVLFNTFTGDVQQVELPEGELVGDAVILDQGRYIAVLIQQYSEEKDEKIKVGRIKLCVYSVEGIWHGVKQYLLNELCSAVNDNDAFLNIRAYGANLLIIYMKGTTSLHYTPDGELDMSIPVKKAAFMYTLRKNKLTWRVEHFLAENSNAQMLRSSLNLSVIMDNHARMYNVLHGKMIHRMCLPRGISGKSATLMLDGCYLAVISEDHREIYIHRCKDGKQMSRLFVHSQATTVCVGVDDRTLIVGCIDGRVMVFTALFQHQDPVNEVVALLPSRNFPVLHNKCPSFKAVGTTVMLVQKSNVKKLSKSKTCTIL